jgi:hypothetical protein
MVIVLFFSGPHTAEPRASQQYVQLGVPLQYPARSHIPAQTHLRNNDI